MKDARPLSPSPTRLARIFTNTAWLLGGKGFGAICSVFYLIILTRSLGLKGFGHFSLIFGTAQALIAIAGFQTWQVVVNFGSKHVHNQDWSKFGRLSMLCGLIDMVGALCGCILAAVLIYGFADTLKLNPAYTDTAFAFCCAMVWALVSAPTGIVRALHRFDLGVYVEAIVPTGRLVAAGLIWWTGPSVARFLFAWAAIDLIEAALYWILARRLRPEAVRLAHLKDWRLTLRENPGVERFFLVTYTGSTLGAITRHGPLLAVGGLVSTRAAGLYRIADQLTQAMSKLSTLLTRAIYAEISHARVSADPTEFRKLALQTSLIATGAGLVVASIAAVAGPQLLALLGGKDFEQGAVILVPLAIAASLELGSVAFEPVLHSTGRARMSLIARVLAALALGLAILVLHRQGAAGIAWAVAVAAAVGYVAMGLIAWGVLRSADYHDTGAAPDGADIVTSTER